MKDYAFGNLITALRVSRGFSQFQLGKLLGVSDKAVSKWENGNAKPRISTCYRLADILGVSLDELLSSKRQSFESLPDMNETADMKEAAEKNETAMGGKDLNKRLDLYPEKRVELHMRTNMSVSDGIVAARDLVSRTLEWEMPAIAITDFCSTQAFPYVASSFQRLPQKVILGCEGFMIDGDSVENGCHIMLLVRNREGLVNLNKLVSLSYTKYFKGLPCMPREAVEQHRRGLLIGSSCEDGEIITLIRKNADQEILEEHLSFYNYLEVQPVENEPDGDRPTLESEIKQIIKLGSDCGKPVVAVSNGRYLDPEDGLSRAVLQYNDGLRDAEFQPPYYLRTTSEMLEAFSFLDEETAKEIVIHASRAISDLVDDQVDLFPAEIHSCEQASPVIEGAERLIKSLAVQRAHQLYGEHLPDIITSRLDKEFSLIGNNWTVMEIARLAAEHSLQLGYPVGNRGTVGSSLVAFLVGITRVNPLTPHYCCPGCRFTLFVNRENNDANSDCGADLPDKACPHCGTKMHRDGFSIPVETFVGLDGKKEMDIDLNFSTEIQKNVHAYICDYFGADRVIRPGIISRLSNTWAEKLVARYATDHNAEGEEFKHAADQISYTVQYSGQHPGGLVFIPESYDVNEFTPVQYSVDSDEAFLTSHYDFLSMHDRLLKMDFLGHDVPTLLMYMGKNSGVLPEEVPINDSVVLSLFRSPDALGISERDEMSPIGVPEFCSRSVQKMLKTVNPTTVEELIRVSGLSHGTGVWSDNAENLIQNQVASVYDCPATRDDITNYLTQHSVPFESAFTISEYIRKGKAFRGLKPEMRDILKKAGVPEWYIHSCEKIRYLFPRAHAVTYVTDYLRLAWYKLYHPDTYYSAWFRVYGEYLDPADLTMDITYLRRAILSIRTDMEDCGEGQNREITLMLLLEMKLRGYDLPKDFFEI